MTATQFITDAISQGLCRNLHDTGWEPVENPIGGTCLRTYRFNEPLVLLCSPDTVGLQFLRHGWSGAVRILVGPSEQVVHLSKEEGSDTVLVDLPPQDRDFEVSIEALSLENREAARCEAWLVGAAFRKVARPVGRSTLINARTKLIYGDWGEFLVLATDQVIPSAIVREGAWAPRDIALFRQHIQPGDVVLDVGANFGHHSVVFSKLVTSSGRVLAIEAQRVMYQLIHANAVLNQCANIVPIHAAAGKERSTVTLYPTSYDGANNFGALGIDLKAETTSDKGEEVDAYPLDDLLESHLQGRKSNFVKIDVQAFELFVLQGMREILQRDKPTVFIEISPLWMKRAGYDFREIYLLLKDLGYNLHHRDNPELAADGFPDHDLETDIEWDLLAVHPERCAR